MSESFSFVQLSRMYWVGPVTVLASVAAVLVVRIVAVVVLHPPLTFAPLLVAPPIIDTVILTGGAVFVFMSLATMVSNPIRTFRIVAALVLLLSFIPDILIVRSYAFGATWPYAFALMTMHVAAWAVCVTMLTSVTIPAKEHEAQT